MKDLREKRKTLRDLLSSLQNRTSDESKLHKLSQKLYCLTKTIHEEEVSLNFLQGSLKKSRRQRKRLQTSSQNLRDDILRLQAAEEKTMDSLSIEQDTLDEIEGISGFKSYDTFLLHMREKETLESSIQTIESLISDHQASEVFFSFHLALLSTMFLYKYN